MNYTYHPIHSQSSCSDQHPYIGPFWYLPCFSSITFPTNTIWHPDESYISHMHFGCLLLFHVGSLRSTTKLKTTKTRNNHVISTYFKQQGYYCTSIVALNSQRQLPQYMNPHTKTLEELNTSESILHLEECQIFISEVVFAGITCKDVHVSIYFCVCIGLSHTYTSL